MGKPWKVIATIQKNGSCNRWLFGMEFFPIGTAAGSWQGGWGIPARGHLPSDFTMGARDEFEGSERAFSGVVGARVRTVVLTTSSGDRITIHPKLPKAGLREQFVWLRNMRYFICYYPTGHHARIAKLFDSHGELIDTIRGEEGGFDGPISGLLS